MTFASLLLISMLVAVAVREHRMRVGTESTLEIGEKMVSRFGWIDWKTPETRNLAFNAVLNVLCTEI